MTNEETETIESKVERIRFTKQCQKCKRYIKGTSAIQLEHTFRMHQMFCLTKDNDETGDVAPAVQ